MTRPISEYILSGHAIREMARRGLAEAVVRQVLAAPSQRETVRPGRDVLQSRIGLEGKAFLVRVFVDVDQEPAVVVTAYRTSKIEKYWRKDP